jgi:nucleotide-binding universal stress UspA family protein
MHQLYELFPPQASCEYRPEATVRFGNPAEQFSTPPWGGADLIVLGVRDAAGHLNAAASRAHVAHKVVAHATCPVLTIRG